MNNLLLVFRQFFKNSDFTPIMVTLQVGFAALTDRYFPPNELLESSH